MCGRPCPSASCTSLFVGSVRCVYGTGLGQESSLCPLTAPAPVASEVLAVGLALHRRVGRAVEEAEVDQQVDAVELPLADHAAVEALAHPVEALAHPVSEPLLFASCRLGRGRQAPSCESRRWSFLPP